MQSHLSIFKALSDTTRLRLLQLCNQADLTVSDLTNILGQSQPRVSRHLKIMVEAGLLDRRNEGQRVFFTRDRRSDHECWLTALITTLSANNDRVLAADLEKLQGSLSARNQLAQGYFDQHAAKWQQVRSLYNDDECTEALFLQELQAQDQSGQIGEFLDLGTGTGRILQIASQHFELGLGVDLNREMLTVARATLSQAGVQNAHVQEADLYNLALEANRFEVAALYHVLHFLEDPAQAIKEAARVLIPGGRVLILDYQSHEKEELRRNHAHLWLGFSDEEVAAWCLMARLELVAQKSIEARGSAPAVSLWVAQRL